MWKFAGILAVFVALLFVWKGFALLIAWLVGGDMLGLEWLLSFVMVALAISTYTEMSKD